MARGGRHERRRRTPAESGATFAGRPRIGRKSRTISPIKGFVLLTDRERPARPPTSYNLNNIIDLGGANTVTAEQARAAALVTCIHAIDADEARELLAMLGLVPEPRSTP